MGSAENSPTIDQYIMKNVIGQAAVLEQSPNEDAEQDKERNAMLVRDLDQDEKNFKTLQLVVFKLKGEEYALRIEMIKEVVLTPKVTPVPQTAGHVKGVANIRGNILAIVDLEARLGLDRADLGPQENGRFTLVLDDIEFKVGILVQDVPNTIEVSEDELDESPDIVLDSTIDDRVIEAIAKVNDRLIILLDIRRALGNDLDVVVARTEHASVANN